MCDIGGDIRPLSLGSGGNRRKSSAECAKFVITTAFAMTQPSRRIDRKKRITQKAVRESHTSQKSQRVVLLLDNGHKLQLR